MALYRTWDFLFLDWTQNCISTWALVETCTVIYVSTRFQPACCIGCMELKTHTPLDGHALQKAAAHAHDAYHLQHEDCCVQTWELL